ncbi:hypothetical protein [Nitrospira lenta]|uniref:DUF5666 domain-containing protein n=1 Tax=Nitrospira lenta TaxID=1436998 RepID=A0A330L476_9BACT|nr:hypothetical protein [Nitrospira lenta]SPP64581.1 conserved exported hypothetical protein [Nitrospira lenta]
MRRAVIVSGLLCMLTGCLSTAGTHEESLGVGIVRGTLGVQSEGQVRLAQPAGASLQGAVLLLEGGAYVLSLSDGSERRVALDENTRIDRPAHVGDRVEAFLDDSGRAVLIRNIDHRTD